MRRNDVVHVGLADNPTACRPFIRGGKRGTRSLSSLFTVASLIGDMYDNLRPPEITLNQDAQK